MPSLDYSYFEAVINSSDDAIISKDLNSVVTSWNRAAERMFGYSQQEILGQSVLCLFPDDRINEEALIIERIKAGQHIEHFETIRLHKSGRLIPVSVSISPIYDAQRQIIGVSNIARDISERVRLNERIGLLMHSIKHYQSVVESSDDAIIAKDLQGIITSWNPGAEHLFGYTAQEMMGQPILRLFPPERVQEEVAILERIANGQRIDHYETERFHKNGHRIHVSVTVSPIFDENERVIGASKIARNITQKVHEQQQIWIQAHHDSLTGLANRKYFLAQLEQAIASASYDKQSLAVMILDVDNFKLINDSLGHRAGDQVLMQIANALRSQTGMRGVVGRMGGDEFAILLTGFHHLFEVEVFNRGVLSSFLSQTVEDQRLTVTASIGVSVFPNDAQQVDALIRYADQALYEAKRQGRNQFRFYSQALESVLNKKNTMLLDIATAIELNQMTLVFQPIMNVRTRRIDKCEALVRWQHPSLGALSPLEFIPIAEEANSMAALTDWLFANVVEALKRWRVLFGQDFQISFNVSPSLLASRALHVFQWVQLLKKHHLDPASLVVEITESSMLKNTQIVNGNLQAIKQAGMLIAIDDFGTGYSCLSVLNNLNVDFIKIDQSFVSGMEHNAKQCSLCDAIIVMAHQLGLSVIAEGVETGQQLQHLQSRDCDFIQGYLLTQPLPGQAFEAYVQQPHPFAEGNFTAVATPVQGKQV